MGFNAKAKSAILFSYRALPGHSLSDTVAFIRDVASKRILEISTLRSAEKKLDGMNDSDFVGDELIGPSGPAHETPPGNEKIAKLNHHARKNANKKWVAPSGERTRRGGQK